ESPAPDRTRGWSRSSPANCSDAGPRARRAGHSRPAPRRRPPPRPAGTPARARDHLRPGALLYSPSTPAPFTLHARAAGPPPAVPAYYPVLSAADPTLPDLAGRVRGRMASEQTAGTRAADGRQRLSAFRALRPLGLNILLAELAPRRG